MRRKALLATTFGLMLGMVVAFGPNASAVSVAWYSGHVGPGQGLLFSINGKGRAQTFSPVVIDFTVTCPVSGDVFDSEFAFFGFAEPMTDGHFDLNLSDPLFQTFDWRGTVNGTSASGHVTAGFPAYDGMGGLQECSSGDAVWHAKNVSSARTAPASKGTILYTVTKTPGGGIRVQVTR
jgi:hypothetical protein